MVKAVIFDMYETLVTLWHTNPYMGREISRDAGIPETVFREIWDTTDTERAIGKLTYEEVIERILKVNNRYSKDLFELLVEKRIASKVESFKHIHAEIIPMLEKLKELGIKIGLVTNCFYEEKTAIEESIIFPYFDAVCMSCVVGIKKPDARIFNMCTEALGVKPEECIYCGDGGSRELETAKFLNMKPIQALWYLQKDVGQPVGRLEEFEGINSPLELASLATIL